MSTGSAEDDLLDVLDEAVGASLLVESAERPGRFSFSHALINHTLYEELGATRRARLHRRVAESLEELCGDDVSERLGELAQHWAAATVAANARQGRPLRPRGGGEGARRPGARRGAALVRAGARLLDATATRPASAATC